MTLPYAFTISCGDGQLSHPPPLAPIFPKWSWDSVLKTLREINTRIALRIIEAQKFYKIQGNCNTANSIHICILIRFCSLNKIDNLLCKLLDCQIMTRNIALKEVSWFVLLKQIKILTKGSDRTERRALGKRWDGPGLPPGILRFILGQEIGIRW